MSHGAPEQYEVSDVEAERRAVRRRIARRRATVAAASSVLVLGLLVAAVLLSPGWEVVQRTFFDVPYGWEVLPKIATGLRLNIICTLIGTAAIALIGMTLALIRTSTSPALAPLRLIAAAYVDIFRGVPTLLVIFLIGFGVPALQLQNVPTNVVVLGTTAVVLCYSAYVAEVLRSGILSVHPSQKAAARSLGLTAAQTLRYVVLPQGIRRVIPPLMNDFVSLLKDTGLISVLGAVDAIRAAQIEASRSFNYTPYVVAAILFLILTIPLTRLTDRTLRRSIEQQNAQING
jgi:polar amino acid transport system permease protein